MYNCNQVVSDWIESDYTKRNNFLREFSEILSALEENIWLNDWQNKNKLKWLENMKESVENSKRKLEFDIEGNKRKKYWRRKREMLDYGVSEGTEETGQ